MDTLTLTGLCASTTIGVHAFERQIKQRIYLDISIKYDFSASEDDITKTLDYAALASCVTHYVENQAFQLIESIAHGVLSLIQKTFDISEVCVSVSKPHAVANARDVRVTVQSGA